MISRNWDAYRRNEGWKHEKNRCPRPPRSVAEPIYHVVSGEGKKFRVLTSHKACPRGDAPHGTFYWMTSKRGSRLKICTECSRKIAFSAMSIVLTELIQHIDENNLAKRAI